MSQVTEPIRRVVADARVTTREWREALKPVAEAVPGFASPEARELLALWADDHIDFEPAAARELALYLQGRGYPASKVGPRPGLTDVSRIVSENVTEVDAELERLAALVGRTTEAMLVAVVDSGFDVTHPALSAKLWTSPTEVPGNGLDDDENGLIDDVHGWDFAGGDATLAGSSHGTHTWGLATRGTDRIDALLVRSHDDSSLEATRLAAALDYAAEQGARVVNMSFKVDTEAEVAAVKAVMARHPRVLFVKTAGNQRAQIGTRAPFLPQHFLPANLVPNMLVVAATDAHGDRGRTSNYGVPFTEVAMRGDNVFSTVPDGAFTGFTGTSMAAPLVTNVAAKLLLLCPELTPDEVKRILVETSDPRESWSGRIRAGGPIHPPRALQRAALIALCRSGFSPEAAADRLGLEGAERARHLSALPSYLG
jgi:subtilisin family serine protease